MNTKKLSRRLSALFLSLVMFVLSTGIAMADNSDKMANFTDVRPGQMYYEAIEYVVTHGYFNGVSEDSFAPNELMTRAMLVTVLGRMAGIEASTYQSPGFTDVASDSYYSGYLSWAAANSIVNGIGGDKFAPENFVTREQVAVFLYRYARHLGMDTNPGHIASPTTFNSDSNVSTWAVSAMVWANNKGIMRGTDSGLNPQAQVTRAEAAQMLYNFSKLLED